MADRGRCEDCGRDVRDLRMATERDRGEVVSRRLVCGRCARAVLRAATAEAKRVGGSLVVNDRTIKRW